MKEGQEIQLRSGRSFILPFTPVEPTGSKGAGRRWPGITDGMWECLFKALQEYNTVDRNEVCKHYSVSYQKLLKQFGADEGELTELEKKYGKRSGVSPVTTLQKIEWLKEHIAEHEGKIEELRKDLTLLKDDGMKELEQKLEELKNL